MINPIIIDLSGVEQKFSLAAEHVEKLAEFCVAEVTYAIYNNWIALAKKELKSTSPEYIQNLIKVDKGRFEQQIVLTGVLPNMLEQGASAFDMKEGFKKSKYVKYTIAKYKKNGMQISQGGDWYLTIPFRIGTPSALGQAGFANVMPQEVYNVMRKKPAGVALSSEEIPSPYDIPQSRAAIMENGIVIFGEYRHKMSIYEGMTKRTAVYAKTSQNTYGTFRRAGKNSDPLAWIHRGLEARGFAQKAIENTDIETIVENEVTNYLDAIL